MSKVRGNPIIAQKDGIYSVQLPMHVFSCRLVNNVQQTLSRRLTGYLWFESKYKPIARAGSRALHNHDGTEPNQGTTFQKTLPSHLASYLGTSRSVKSISKLQTTESSIARVPDSHDRRLRTRAGRVKQRTSNKPRRRTAIKVSSFFDSAGFRMAALVFRNAFPKMV